MTTPDTPAPPAAPDTPLIALAATVRLRSGGPDMTVTRLARHDGAPGAWCAWFDRGRRQEQPFPLLVLEPAPPPGAAGKEEVVDVDEAKMGPAPCGRAWCKRRPWPGSETWAIDPEEGTERRVR